ncbi:hypothetical protein H6G76_06065 [Nostoc sp. FACHB-152]|uniref:hypothetical protein n=1 Tax=unclassified Nostoc TaxID=2593658 RepID=UPI001686E98A|nr:MULTISPECIES: hypothetical protein [unclassified Nostoc]MBD2446738.1 hypothetical protein [Nostoc sp. FACHB-152]MBD2466586.1 hypothetical protein [Nostoc sp. FACHB-145]
MKKNLFLAAFSLSTAALASALLSTPAKAVDYGVKIEVVVPDVVFLETYDTITFKPTIADLTGGNTSGTFTSAKTDVTGDLASPTISQSLGGITGPGLTSTNKTYENVPVYRFWGLGGGTGKIRHKISYNGNDLTKGINGSTVTVSVTGNNATGIADDAPGLDYAEAIEKTLNFTFNFAGVQESGLHTGGVLTITATAE